jgi:hypothetical protein
MTKDSARAAGLLHLRQAAMTKGDPVALPLTLAAMYHLPGRRPAIWPLQQSDGGGPRARARTSRRCIRCRLPFRHGGNFGGFSSHCSRQAIAYLSQTDGEEIDRVIQSVNTHRL